MKKKGAVLVNLCILCALICAADTPKAKVSDWAADVPNTYFFSGFEFSDYKPSAFGIDSIIADEYIRMKTGGTYTNMYNRNNTVTPPDGPYTIIGHSQGGLRVLAYAAYLQRHDPASYKNIRAVITVSGTDKGLKALEGGFPRLRARFLNDVNIAWRGIRAGLCILDVGKLLGTTIPSDISDVTLWLLNFLPKNIRCYIKPAMEGASPDSMAELRDMMPGSSFIKNNVVDSKPYMYKVQTGTRSYLQLRWKWIFPYWVRVYEPVYSYYTAYEDIPQFGKNLPVGYIVGLNNNSLSMTDSEQSIRKTLSGLGTGFKVIKYAHITKCVIIWGLFSGSIGYADDADKAMKLMQDFDGELNIIKGSPENDGLVAKESQYIPKTFTNPNTGKTVDIQTNVLGQDSDGYIKLYEYNHANIMNGEKTKKHIMEMITEATKNRQ